MFIRFIALVALLLTASPALAQNSGIAGVVKDTTGALLPGVTVEATSPALIERTRTAVSDDQGQYKIVDLRPGVYAVTFALAGFTSVRREGIELSANFTAPVNAELRVGAIQETVTVAGQTPVVDVQNVVQRNVITRDILDAVPNAKTIPAFAAMTPGVVLPPTGQDVGGSKGEVSNRMVIHGGRANEQKLLMDGMGYNTMESGSSRGYFLNPATSSEVSLQLGGGSAEFQGGGIQINSVPKEGGNRFSGYFFNNYTDHQLQNDNLSDEIRSRGLTTVNTIDRIFDSNWTFGGPIKADRLWFFTSHRWWRNSNTIPGIYYNATQASYAYTKDLTRPATVRYRNESHSLRLTWQAAARHKINMFFDHQNNCDCTRDLGNGTMAPEAAVNYRYSPNELSQVAWSFPATNKLLIDAGATLLLFNWPNVPQPEVAPGTISVIDNGFRYRAGLNYGERLSSQVNEKFNVSYVTGSHAFKFGLQNQQGWHRGSNQNANDMSYTFLNGVTQSVTLYAGPNVLNERLRSNLGLFVQDQWTVRRLTLNVGLRYDYMNAYVPEQHLPAGRFVPKRDFDPVECVPCFSDLGPRLGVAYDLFGNGRTGLKFSVGRYVASYATDLARANNPVQTSVSSATRPWTDTNGNYNPDCDFTNPATTGECGPLSNPNFGKLNITSHNADNVIKGFGNRDYNWQLAASVQHELARNVSVNAGYYRTWYGNFTATDNRLVTPADYDPYCITVPNDPRLPGAGTQLCGFYDIKPAAFLLGTDNYVVQSSAFGEQTEVFNGVDFGVNGRLPHGAVLQGGISTGRSHTNRCLVVDSPQALQFCDNVPPFLTQIKILGSYPLPWGLQASANYQNLPGIPIAASYVATLAEIQPSLGRPLAGGVRSVTIPNLFAPNTRYEKRITQADVRLAKNFAVGRSRVQGQFDIYNVFNASTILVESTRYGNAVTPWLQPSAILDARLFKFGVQVNF